MIGLGFAAFALVEFNGAGLCNVVVEKGDCTTEPRAGKGVMVTVVAGAQPGSIDGGGI